MLALAHGIGDNLHTLGAFCRELARDVEAAQRVNLVTKEVDTIGLRFYIREDVDNTSAHGVLARLVDKVHALEAMLHKPVYKSVLLQSISDMEL